MTGTINSSEAQRADALKEIYELGKALACFAGELPSSGDSETILSSISNTQRVKANNLLKKAKATLPRRLRSDASFLIMEDATVLDAAVDMLAMSLRVNEWYCENYLAFVQTMATEASATH